MTPNTLSSALSSACIFVLSAMSLAGCAEGMGPPPPNAVSSDTPAANAAACTLTKEGETVAYECGEIKGTVLQVSEGSKAALDRYQKQLDGELKGRAKVHGEPAALDDMGISGRHVMIEWRDKEKPATEGYVWAFENKESGNRLVTCASKGGTATLADCRKALIDLTTTIAHAVAKPGAREESAGLFGHPIAAPDGCSLEHKGAGMSVVSCGNAKLFWGAFADMSSATMLDQVSSGLSAKLKVTKTETPKCWIMGEPAKCRRQTATVPGATVISFYGVAERQGAKALVQCTWPGDVASMPSFCTDVMSGKAPR